MAYGPGLFLIGSCSVWRREFQQETAFPSLPASPSVCALVKRGMTIEGNKRRGTATHKLAGSGDVEFFGKGRNIGFRSSLLQYGSPQSGEVVRYLIPAFGLAKLEEYSDKTFKAKSKPMAALVGLIPKKTERLELYSKEGQ
jgi:hypothetical protein